MANSFRVAGVQMCSGTEPDANLDAIETLMAEAAGRGARYVLTPEVSIAFAENREGLSRVAGPFEGSPAVARAAEIARRHGIHLHIGSMAVALPDGRFANRSVLFGPDGAIAATYDKIHLFDANLTGLQAYRESHTYRGGEKATLTKAPGFSLGMTICYDVRFPALFNALAKAGADAIAVPAAFTVPTGRAHWEILLRARAIETGTFVIAAAQGGQHQNGRKTYGHSMIVDPWGTILAKMDGDAPGVIVADIDLDRIAEARSQVPVLDNERDFTLARLG